MRESIILRFKDLPTGAREHKSPQHFIKLKSFKKKLKSNNSVAASTRRRELDPSIEPLQHKNMYNRNTGWNPASNPHSSGSFPSNPHSSGAPGQNEQYRRAEWIQSELYLKRSITSRLEATLVQEQALQKSIYSVHCEVVYLQAELAEQQKQAHMRNLQATFTQCQQPAVQPFQPATPGGEFRQYI